MTEAERRARNKAFTPEESITFNMIDKDTLELLQERKKVKLPRKKISVPKDKRWNTKYLNSVLLHGILNGNSIPKITHEVFGEIMSKTDLKGRTDEEIKGIIKKNKEAAVRNARTMVTEAENHGRLDSYQDLADQGVVQKKVWIATPDGRTRESHLMLDGEEVDIDEEFSNGLMYPADPSGDPEEVWNCRCTMRDRIVGFRRADGTISEVGYDHDNSRHERQMEEEKERRR